MNSESHLPHDLAPALEDRFRHQPLSAKPSFSAKIQQRLHQSDPQEAALDALLQPDPRLGRPDMAERVRQRILADDSRPSGRLVHFPWQRWIAPVAAAATLALAFISFQQQAPDQPRPATATLNAESTHSTFDALANDEQLTQIFALAHNLKPAVEVDKVRSPDSFPFLMQ